MKKLQLVFLSALLLIVQKAGAQNPCPNSDFENWYSKTYNVLDSGWHTSNPFSISSDDTMTVWPVTGFSGEAVHIQTAIVGIDTFRGMAANTYADPVYGFVEHFRDAPQGMPYSQMPSALTGYYRYSLATNDSAYIEVVFKHAGAIVSDDKFRIHGTGSEPTFTAFSLPLSLSVMPDTVIIVAMSDDPFSANALSTDWLELDQLAFAGPGITQNIAGGSFDVWTPHATDRPVGWNTNVSDGPQGVVKSTDHHSGSFSVQLITQPKTDETVGGLVVAPGFITNGHILGYFSNTQGLPYTDTVGILAGYYKYATTGADSGNITAATNMDYKIHYFKPAATWTYFEMSLHPSLHIRPDSLWISIASGDDYGTLGSTLWIDSLHITDVSLLVGVKNVNEPLQNIVAYPNPAHDVLSIKLNEAMQGHVGVKIYDVMGREIVDKAYEFCPYIIPIPVDGLANGLYFYEVSNNDAVMRNKFVKQ